MSESTPDNEHLLYIAQTEMDRQKEEMTIEDIEAHRAYVREVFWEPAPVSARTEEWINEIAGNEVSEYRILRKVEEAFSKFEYDTSPGKLPSSVRSPESFLDYFLFEEPHGYCTYFASAFAVIARHLGLPSRFVQGFVVSAEKNGQIPVYSNMSHAWPEVYFEGIGWIPFEPTPGYLSYRYELSSWEVSKKEQEASPVPDTPTPSGAPEPFIPPELPEIPDVPQEIQPDPVVVFSLMDLLKWVFSGIGILLGVLLLILLAERLVRGIRYALSPVSGKYQSEYKRCVHVLGLLGFRREESETVSEFRERLLLEPDFSGLLDYTKDYEEIRYGSRTADVSTLRKTARSADRLLKLLRKKRLPLYLFYRIFRF